jgi:hypothetical protein
MFPLSVYAQQPTQPVYWNTLTGEQVNCMVDGVPTLKCLEAVFSNVVFMASTLVIVILLVMFVVGGVSYITSFGNPEKVKKAQNTLKFAIIGFILFMSSFLILKSIDYLFLGNQNKIFKFNIDVPASGP